MKPVASCVLTDDDARGKGPHDGQGQQAARRDPPDDRGIRFCHPFHARSKGPRTSGNRMSRKPTGPHNSYATYVTPPRTSNPPTSPAA